MSGFSLENRTAIVTGGSKGIGRAIALLFAENGADVCISARGKEALETTRKEIEQRGRRAIAVPADIMEDGDLERVVEEARSQLGGVDILVNNAIYSGDMAMHPAAELTRDEYMKTIQGNLWAPLRLAQLCRLSMIERGRGVIVNISSNAGLIGDPMLGAYAHSKAALINMTQQLAKEWAGDDIRVCGIAPGLVRTPATDGPRGLIAYFEKKGSGAPAIGGLVGEPEDIASVALLLASDAGRYCNAMTYVVDGGEYVRGPAL
jgi:NAD(P)-dependent dehydrogenase (short-subunit alcohol dehydrogenase family)